MSAYFKLHIRWIPNKLVRIQPNQLFYFIDKKFEKVALVYTIAISHWSLSQLFFQLSKSAYERQRFLVPWNTIDSLVNGIRKVDSSAKECSLLVRYFFISSRTGERMRVLLAFPFLIILFPSSYFLSSFFFLYFL